MDNETYIHTMEYYLVIKNKPWSCVSFSLLRRIPEKNSLKEERQFWLKPAGSTGLGLSEAESHRADAAHLRKQREQATGRER
jgi:hypothetical protein